VSETSAWIRTGIMLLTRTTASRRASVQVPYRGVRQSLQAGQWPQVPPHAVHQLWPRQRCCHGRPHGHARREQGLGRVLAWNFMALACACHLSSPSVEDGE
jgi:hypothetical protein